MRKDMFKVIVERGRRGGHGARKRRPPRDIEDVPARGHKRAASESGDRKDLNETLAPLARFIAKQVGRPWNKVYSELRENIKVGNTVQEHVLTHVEQFIELHVDHVEPDQDNPCGVRARAGRFYTTLGLRPGDLYVDPNDGLVKRARAKINYDRKSWKTRHADEWRSKNKLLSNDLFARKIDGIWYGYHLEPYEIDQRMERVPLEDGSWTSKKTVEFIFTDAAGKQERFTSLLEQVIGRTYHANDSVTLESLAKHYGGRRLFARRPKHQLSAAALRAESLENDVGEDT